MKKLSLYTMALLYIAAGLNHFFNTASYSSIMPPWIPLHKKLVIVSGMVEIAGGLLLLFKSTRRSAAYLIILLLLAVFPANLQMMLNYAHEKNPALWLTILRLPLQGVLIWWAYGFTKKAKKCKY